MYIYIYISQRKVLWLYVCVYVCVCVSAVVGLSRLRFECALQMAVIMIR